MYIYMNKNILYVTYLLHAVSGCTTGVVLSALSGVESE